MTCRALAIVQGTDADVLVKKGPGLWYGASFLVAADGVIKIYDAASVATIADTKLLAAGKWDVSVDGFEWNVAPAEPVKFTLGLVIVITDAAASVGSIWYK